jgi:glycosyltransferase involved in cell wall biosynthesis
MSLPFVSVVVPTRGGGETLSGCLAALLEQDYPPDRYELIVVENPPSERTAATVAALAGRAPHPALRYLSLPRPDASAARNAGFDAARGDPICMVDDDVITPRGWLRALTSAVVRNPDAGCVGGAIRPRFEHPPRRTCGQHGLAGTSLDEGPEEIDVKLVWSGNMAVRRAALERVGPFKTGLKAAEEWEWERRLRAAGGRVVYTPHAWLWHRRFREDMRIRPMLLKYFRAGLTVGGHKRPDGMRAWLEQLGLNSVRVARWSWHAVRCRCIRGLTDAARCAGILCATAVGPWRRRGA